MIMEFQQIMTNPNITFLLMTIGAYGIILEFSHPGAYFPGIMGGICLLLAAYGLNVLPIDHTGLLLMLLGIACMTAEAFVPSFGVLGIGGGVAFALGGTLLIKSDATIPHVSLWLIGTMTAISLGFLSVALTLVLRARKRPVSTGAEALRHATGDIIQWSRSSGEALVEGSIWKVKSSTDYILKKGDKVKVVDIEGLCLIIQPVH